MAENTETKNLKEAVDYLGVSAGVIRMNVKLYEEREKLRAFDPSQPMVGLPATRNADNHLVFKVDDLEAFKNREKRSGGGQRGDGKKYLVRLTAEQVADFKGLFPTVELADPYATNKQYQAAQRAKKAIKAVE